ncbi:hypothetical protein [Bradyrhizobium sp. Tv2a-2]|nr:hypothetical protein [Bradyrhizobium sp. Tv2a-2]
MTMQSAKIIILETERDKRRGEAWLKAWVQLYADAFFWLWRV